MIAGHTDPGFAAVREAFAANFADHDEIGAAVCVTVEHRTVVDLWGGHADEARTRPWEPDTLVNAFSIGKALTALCALRLVGAGDLGLDVPVSRWWPEFGAAGKERVTLAEVLAHRAGLPAVRRRLPPGSMLSWETMTGALAAQEPWWDPGTAHGYHTNTFGFLVGELVRRVRGRSLGAVLRDEIAEPLGADVYIGLPASEDRRVAHYTWEREPPPEEEPEGLGDAELMWFNTYFNPSGLSGLGVINTRAWRAAEIPSTNAHGTARGVAKIFEALAAGGRLEGMEVVDSGVLADAAVERSSGTDLILGRPSRFGLGFQLTQPERPIGPNPRTFGHFGAGGSLAFADPDAGVAFAYLRNRMEEGWQNPCNRALIEAVYAVLR